MKRLIFLAGLLFSSVGMAQTVPFVIPKSDYVVSKDGGAFIIPAGYLSIKDETTALAQQNILTFLGAGVTCANNAGNAATECTIPGGAGSVATDTIWDAAGDLVVGTGADTAAKLTKGADGKVLTMTAGAVGWASLPAAAGAVLLQASSPGTPDVGNFNITGIGTSTHDAAGATLTPGFFLSNTTAASVGAQQYSPSLKLCGQGWTTAAGGSSETDCWQVLARPVQGNPSSVDLVFQTSLAGAAYSQTMYMQSNGHLTLGLAGTTVGVLSLQNATSGNVLLQPATGALGSSTYVFQAGSGTVAVLESPALTTPSVGNGATGPGSIAVLEDSDNGTNKITVIGQSTLAADRVYTLPDLGANGTFVVQPTVAATDYPGLGFNPKTTSPFYEDFYARTNQTAAGAVSALGRCWSAGSGTASGFTAPATAIIASSPVNHPGIVAATTGSTTTGSGVIGCGNLAGASAGGNGDGPVLIGNEILEWNVLVPTASDGTNQHKIWIGMCDDQTATACNDEMAVYWDNQVDTHWGCEAIVNGSATAAISTTVATAAAWHTIRFELNSDASSAVVKVDGSTLSCSPVAPPHSTNRGMPLMTKVVAQGVASSCNAVAKCSFAADYVYFYEPSISR